MLMLFRNLQPRYRELTINKKTASQHRGGFFIFLDQQDIST